MSPKGKKSKLSVQFKPLEGGGAFDIRPPENNEEWRAPEPVGERQGKWREFGTFFAIAFSIFLLFSALGLGMGGVGFFEGVKPLAFAGYDSLREGVGALKVQDFAAANQWFSKSERSFADLSEHLRGLTSQANQELGSPLYLDTASKLVESGVAGAQIGRELTEIVEEAKTLPEVFVSQGEAGTEKGKLTDILRRLNARLESVNAKALSLQNDLTTLNVSTLPASVQSKIRQAQEPVGLFLGALSEIRQNFGTALKLLGDKVPHRYLVLLQNSRELRPTGGFIGSYMLVDVNDGAIEKMETKDVYETDGNLLDVVPAPAGIDRLSGRLFMRDANTSPDFPTSAKQIMWFLEHSRGPSVDTVVAIDQTVAEALLGLTGPIPVEGLPFPVSAANFNDLFSFNIESKLSDSKTPKQLLIDFVPLLKEKLMGFRDFPKLAEVATALVQSRHIQVYSEDAEIEALAARLNVDGRMLAPAPKTDFLATVTTAIGGNKSDAFIRTNLTHHTTVDALGKLTDRLEITKTHAWTEADFATWKALAERYGTGQTDLKTLRLIQGAGDNLDYMRVYVPKGSVITGLEGLALTALDSSEDLGYTVFAFPFGPVSAGQAKTIALTYTLPFDLKTAPGDIYKFINQKQAGSENITLNKSVAVSDRLKIVETYPESAPGAFTLYPAFQTPLDSNQIFLSAIASAIN